jgi:hypothetical protein
MARSEACQKQVDIRTAMMKNLVNIGKTITPAFLI